MVFREVSRKMEEEPQHHYELRSRSRSRSHTPMVQNQSLHEGETPERHYDLRSKSRERSHTPGEVTSSRRSGTRSLPGSASKQVDKSMGTIVERKEESKADEAKNEQIRRSESSTSSNVSRKIERRSERQRVKRQIFSNGQTETKEQHSSSSSEGRTAEKRKSVTPRRTITSDYSSEEGEKEDPPSRPGSAYEIYKQAGDWWNVFPKTDYTYSQNSQSRYEIAPGVLAMPNMSRPSIHSDGNSTSGSVNSLSQQNLSQCSRGTRESYGDSLDGGDARETIEQNRLNEVNSCRLRTHVARAEMSEGSIVYKKTHVAQYKSRREIIYGEPSNFTRRDRYGVSSQIDSDTELDEALSMQDTNRVKKWKIREWSETIGRTIVMWYYSVWRFVNVRIFQRKNATTSHEYHRYRESKWKKAWGPIDRIMQYLYFLLVRILFLDTWLLSRASSARENLKRRRAKVLWLILLPPLLLAGFWFLSCALDAMKLLTVARNSTQEAYVTKLGILEPPTKQENQIRSKAANVDDERIKTYMEPLLRRVEKLEAEETSKVQRIETINQAVKELRDSNITIWERYSDKLDSMEKNLIEKSGESSSEINAMKLEFQSLRELYAGLKTCCDKRSLSASDEDIGEHVDRVVSGYFGNGVSKQKLRQIVESLVVANDDKRSMNIGDDGATSLENGETLCTGTSSNEDVRKIVSDVLKIYDADKTGRADYALESAGGQVISTRCTQRYNVHTRAFKLLGVTLFYESNNPRTVIQGNALQPGVCWAFQDFPGYLLIKLRGSIRVTGFTVEHVPRSILPNGEMRSAPRKFNVWGLKDENDVDPVMFGDYEFLDSEESLQYFPVQNAEITEPYEYVELRIHSNQGQLEYTCLYRFRVHGTPV